MSKKKERPAEHSLIRGVSWGKLSDPNVELLESRFIQHTHIIQFACCLSMFFGKSKTIYLGPI